LKDVIMAELVKTLRRHTPPQRLEKMLRDHLADPSGHCPTCRCVGPCTTYTAARAARLPFEPVAPETPA
jgi:hypothetical protein